MTSDFSAHYFKLQAVDVETPSEPDSQYKQLVV